MVALPRRRASRRSHRREIEGDGRSARLARLRSVRSAGPCYALELKREGETLCDDQEEFQTWCIASGVPHSVGRTVDEALAVLGAWGALRIKIGGRS